MNSLMQFVRSQKVLLGGVLFGVISVYLLASTIAVYRVHSATQLLATEIVSHEVELEEIVAVVHGSGLLNGVTDKVRDCASGDRAEFETLLSKLEDGLAQPELDDLSVLFDRCASVTADRRVMITFHLAAKIKSLKTLIQARDLLTTQTDGYTKMTRYDELLRAEETINQKLFDLVDLQAEIIEALRAGLSLNSSEADTLRVKGGQIQNEITIQTEIINLLRKELAIE